MSDCYTCEHMSSIKVNTATANVRSVNHSLQHTVSDGDATADLQLQRRHGKQSLLNANLHSIGSVGLASECLTNLFQTELLFYLDFDRQTCSWDRKRSPTNQLRHPDLGIGTLNIQTRSPCGHTTDLASAVLRLRYLGRKACCCCCCC